MKMFVPGLVCLAIGIIIGMPIGAHMVYKTIENTMRLMNGWGKERYKEWLKAMEEL